MANALRIMTGRGKSFNALFTSLPAGHHHFWIGLNGTYHSDAADAPRGGATQSLAHGQLGSVYMPVFGQPLQLRATIGNVRILTFVYLHQSGFVLEFFFHSGVSGGETLVDWETVFWQCWRIC
jgi:hypothetical protein